MNGHILLPVDLSGLYEPMLDAVRRIASKDVTRVTFLHVIETLQDVPFEEMEDFYADLRARAEEQMAQWVKELQDVSREVVCEVAYGGRVAEIARFAEENRTDLIILRSRPFDRDHPSDTFGTLSHQVAVMAPCAVLLVR